MTTTETLTGERADLLESLAKHRHFRRYTVRDLTDEQAGRRTTVSELCLGGLIKHVTWAERQWANFILQGAAAIVAGLPDLDVSHPLPEAPWFEPGARWSARRVLLHLIGETAQHAGHADILRESIDGAKSMG
jgi:hypothetical protein